MQVSSFDPATATKAHGGTILSAPVLPEGLSEPFRHAWGYLKAAGVMEAHSHETEEVYLFFKGEGVVMVAGEEHRLRPGDVVNIPPDAIHSVRNESAEPLLWAAFWWPAPE